STLTPPRSSLFPYTTLFRSSVTGASAGNCGGDIVFPSGLAPTPARHCSRWSQHWHRTSSAPTSPAPQEQTAPTPVPPFGRRGQEDRKSTRLNSSHRTISYAV